MCYYGVRGIPLDWFKNYLNNRYKSTHKEIICGIPQGSVFRTNVICTVNLGDFGHRGDFGHATEIMLCRLRSFTCSVFQKYF